ncbi:hypothetical protein ACFVHA_28575 [Bacillus cereus]|uniref:hypothetical protein n=1 Tax=Bacillus cereus TaxID=1396 RepID=UPI00363C6F63
MASREYLRDISGKYDNALEVKIRTAMGYMECPQCGIRTTRSKSWQIRRHSCTFSENEMDSFHRALRNAGLAAAPRTDDLRPDQYNRYLSDGEVWAEQKTNHPQK